MGSRVLFMEKGAEFHLLGQEIGSLLLGQGTGYLSQNGWAAGYLFMELGPLSWNRQQGFLS
jgi:hypothetical protein